MRLISTSWGRKRIYVQLLGLWPLAKLHAVTLVVPVRGTCLSGLHFPFVNVGGKRRLITTVLFYRGVIPRPLLWQTPSHAEKSNPDTRNKGHTTPSGPTRQFSTLVTSAGRVGFPRGSSGGRAAVPGEVACPQCRAGRAVSSCFQH